MYAGVPTTAPSRVRHISAADPVSLTGMASSAGPGAAPCPARASPKSRTRTRPSVPTITLSGLKSRWLMPARCAAARPRAAAVKISSNSRIARSRWRIHAPTVLPSTSSMAMNTSRPTVPTSNTDTTFGWATRASVRASRSSRA